MCSLRGLFSDLSAFMLYQMTCSPYAHLLLCFSNEMLTCWILGFCIHNVIEQYCFKFTICLSQVHAQSLDYILTHLYIRAQTFLCQILLYYLFIYLSKYLLSVSNAQTLCKMVPLVIRRIFIALIKN